MNLLGLNGLTPPFTRYGRISHFFYDGCFPEKWTWFQRDIDKVIAYYHARHRNQDYMLIGFSAGGTLAHEVAAKDPYCKALIVHSGLWRPVENPRDIPILLVTTNGDRTPCDEATEDALEFYWSRGIKTVHVALNTNRILFRHQFRNGLPVMKMWANSIGQDLPVKEMYLQGEESC